MKAQLLRGMLFVSTLLATSSLSQLHYTANASLQPITLPNNPTTVDCSAPTVYCTNWPKLQVIPLFRNFPNTSEDNLPLTCLHLTAGHFEVNRAGDSSTTEQDSDRSGGNPNTLSQWQLQIQQEKECHS
ncbi:MAG: hypothetical protein AAF572_09690 [Cyanobacteria bacterium P01_B01_bin.77]